MSMSLSRVPGSAAVAGLLALGLSLAACPSRSSGSSAAGGGAFPFPSGAEPPVITRPVVTGPAGRLLLTFQDEMSTSFRLVKILVALDGSALLLCQADGERRLDAASPLYVFDGDLEAGEHQLGIELIFRGEGHGVFSYLQGYTFRASSVHEFELSAAQFLALHATAFEAGDQETALEERPNIRFEDRSASPPLGDPRRGCPWADEGS